MQPHPDVLLIIGIIFILGLTADILGRKTSIPRISFLIVIGIGIGPHGMQLLPQNFVQNWFPDITTIALGMIGFLLGQQFTKKALEKVGQSAFMIALGKVLASFILLCFALILLDIPYQAALILASIASATAPTAIYEVISELKINTPFTKTLLSVVALDDIFALILFSLVLAFLSTDIHNSIIQGIFSGGFEIISSILIGYALGYPIAKITGRISKGEPLVAEALGSVFLICGLALYLELSTILAAMAMGSAVSTFAKHHQREFHVIKHIRWPFMIMFFLLAGASLHLEALYSIGLIGCVYIFVRIIGFYLGARIAAKLCHAQINIQKYLGLALIPQAGVAIGMALMASQRFEQWSHLILPVILGTTVVFELIGPIISKYAINKSNQNN